ncbi:MAG: TonB family protein [Candidatus Sulfotelmatobacter sp.]
MRRPHQLALLLFIAFGAWSASHVETLVAQVAAPPETPRFEVVLNNVYLPVYPPLARQARIMGDVKILVGVRQDGSVASAEVVSGHPMLKQAALDSAQKSTFLCRECKGAVTLFTVTYTFGTRVDSEDPDCGGSTGRRPAKCFGLPARKPAVGQTLDHVIILADPVWIQAEPSR